ncbi:hypothetical protein Pst134EA_019564 [Puccinia striiformis f. sp. tritici]|uniref:hypothetical protein n=1 Tax=Puccinia striiformis f. sp. tritici TaxID=168172 RepID=UPI0020075FD0|nr:hypothetical protein Pst134EA_019564 [Puccinia striiformis f. sp. tritici]KAH9449623.1 hypothetical protein Pst134EB_020441 [Puccinia striiformis f. sp. tritici]KAH9459411.1 hypothetical protein Pst134EA_019564 [Puccinia striiformis f. sp. tritici]KAI9610555.1 hypothetical protein H4Q26_006698 [Puccinia striiformis f. sp. tritici PST-130]KAI9619104.1 hypothetical protein KEM48_006383 [Puccinia striiformis f. sp. tritici PST-130]
MNFLRTTIVILTLACKFAAAAFPCADKVHIEGGCLVSRWNARGLIYVLIHAGHPHRKVPSFNCDAGGVEHCCTSGWIDAHANAYTANPDLSSCKGPK